MPSYPLLWKEVLYLDPSYAGTVIESDKEPDDVAATLWVAEIRTAALLRDHRTVAKSSSPGSVAAKTKKRQSLGPEIKVVPNNTKLLALACKGGAYWCVIVMAECITIVYELVSCGVPQDRVLSYESSPDVNLRLVCAVNPEHDDRLSRVDHGEAEWQARGLCNYSAAGRCPRLSVD